MKSTLPPMDSSMSSQASNSQHKRAVFHPSSDHLSQKNARYDQGALPTENPLPCSPLERLPTEVLEMIFMHSLNLSLPRASPVLGGRLASDHMKTELFLLVFLSEGSNLRHLDYLLAILGTEGSIGNLQSEIMALKWATPAFVCAMTEPFMVRTIVHAFRSHGLGWLDKSRSVDYGGAQRAVHGDHFDKGVLDTTKEATIDVVRRFYEHTIAGGKIKEGVHTQTDFREWKWPFETARRTIEMYIGYREGRMTLFGIESGKSLPRVFLDFQSRQIHCAADFRIPTKLLHGPWSDDKCTELLRICRGGGRIDQTGSTMDEEVADAGLREAIIEENHKAIVALVGSITAYRAAPAVIGEDDCSTCITVAFGPEQLKDKYCQRHIHRFCVGVTVRTEHVKLALDKDCSYSLLYTLLHGMKVEIDWTDTELTAWAIQKKKEADERGQWLLDRLASSNFVRYNEDYLNSEQKARALFDEHDRQNNLLSESDLDD